MKLLKYKLPDTPKARKFISVLTQEQAVTMNVIGIIKQEYRRQTDNGLESKKQLKAISIWLCPWLFVIDIRK